METLIELPENVVPMPAEQRAKLKELAEAASPLNEPWASAYLGEYADYALATPPAVALATLDYVEALEAHNQEQARRLTELESQLAQMVQPACECGEDEVCALRQRAEKAESELAAARQELAEQAGKHKGQLQALLAEFVAGTEPADISKSMKMHSEPAFGEFLRGMNSVHNTNLRWARWKAAKFGLPWPLPAAEFEFGYTNEDGSTSRPTPEAPAAPTLVGDETPGPPVGIEPSIGNRLREQVSTSLCWCRACDAKRPRSVRIRHVRMIVCPDCGNKRCPKADSHEYACTNSNEPGQKEQSAASLVGEKGLADA